MKTLINKNIGLCGITVGVLHKDVAIVSQIDVGNVRDATIGVSAKKSLIIVSKGYSTARPFLHVKKNQLAT